LCEWKNCRNTKKSEIIKIKKGGWMKNIYKALNELILKPFVKPATASAGIVFGVEKLIESDYVGAAIGFAIGGTAANSLFKDYGYNMCNAFKDYASKKMSI